MKVANQKINTEINDFNTNQRRTELKKASMLPHVLKGQMKTVSQLDEAI